MDLSAIKPVTITVDLRHPGNGKLTGLSLECTSLESEAVKRVKRAQTNRYMKLRNRKPTAEELEESNVDIYVAAVTGWKWNDGAVWHGGKPLDFSAENVRQVITTPWIRTQIAEALEDETAFFES